MARTVPWAFKIYTFSFSDSPLGLIHVFIYWRTWNIETMNPLPDFSCVTYMMRCWTRKFKDREDGRKKCFKALLFTFRFVLVLFIWAAGRQRKGVQLLLLLPLRLSANGSFVEDCFVVFFFYERVNGVFKEGLNHVRSSKTELHTRK